MFRKRFGVTDIVVGESGDIYFIENVDQDDELERIREEQRVRAENNKKKVQQNRNYKKKEIKEKKRSNSFIRSKRKQSQEELDEIKSKAKNEKLLNILEDEKKNEDNFEIKIKKEPELR